MALTKSALAMLAAMIVTAAWAEDGPMPEDIAWKLLEIGHVIDAPKTAALYAPLQEKSPITASGSSGMSNTALPSATCSMSSCRRPRHRRARY